MTDLPPRLRTASALGIISASLLAGFILLPTSPAATSQPLSRKNPTPRTTPHPTTILALLSTSSFLYLSWSLIRTFEQRRGELFAAAFVFAGLSIPQVPTSWKSTTRSGADGREERGPGEQKEEGRRGWQGWFSLVGAVVGAWATLGEV